MNTHMRALLDAEIIQQCTSKRGARHTPVIIEGYVLPENLNAYHKKRCDFLYIEQSGCGDSVRVRIMVVEK